MPCHTDYAQGRGQTSTRNETFFLLFLVEQSHHNDVGNNIAGIIMLTTVIYSSSLHVYIAGLGRLQYVGPPTLILTLTLTLFSFCGGPTYCNLPDVLRIRRMRRFFSLSLIL